MISRPETLGIVPALVFVVINTLSLFFVKEINKNIV